MHFKKDIPSYLLGGGAFLFQFGTVLLVQGESPPHVTPYYCIFTTLTV